MNEALKSKKLFIFDMDGTIYLGSQVFPFSIHFIKQLRQSGRKILFFTNNSSHNHSFYINKLTAMGFEPSDDEILTSGDVTAQFISRKRQGKKVFLLGTDELFSVFEASGIPLCKLGEVADIVVSSFDTSLTYKKLSNACTQIFSGAEYLCTHPDFNCPTENGFIPDSGAIAAFITASTGAKPKFFGKPYRETLEMICEFTGFSKDDMCIFGDRLYTDIALGKNFGVTSVLVLTGETKKSELLSSEKSLLPDFVYESLKEVSEDIFI